jgi:NAD(P)-dependent dehydrogenase (short-subunit alcohol dehydrogenase family)
MRQCSQLSAAPYEAPANTLRLWCFIYQIAWFARISVSEEVDAADPAGNRLRRVVEEGTAIVPIGRPGDPAEVAAAVAFLAGEDSRFTTGHAIYVNGGSSMG